MKRLQTWLMALRVLAVLAVLLSGMLLSPYIALPYERVSWQRFAGLYAYNPPTPTPSETATATVMPSKTATPDGTSTETATVTGTVTETPDETATSSATATGVISGSLPDLVVGGMRIELENGSSCGYTSTTLGLRVTISNEGTANVTRPFTLDVNTAQLRIDGSVVPPGGTISFWVSGYSSNVNTATVDSLNEITESNESNNTRSEQLAVPTLPPTCTATTTASTPSASTTISTTPTAGTPTVGTPTTGAVAKLNYTAGRPGSYFSVTVSGFPASTILTISADGTPLGTLATDASGVLNFTISSLKAAPRVYTITVATGGAQPTVVATASGATNTPGRRPTNPIVADTTSVTFQITLDTAAPLRAQENTSWPVVSLPLTSVAGTYKNYLPDIIHR